MKKITSTMMLVALTATAMGGLASESFARTRLPSHKAANSVRKARKGRKHGPKAPVPAPAPAPDMN